MQKKLLNSLSLRFKTIFGVIILIVGMASVLTLAYIRHQREVLQNKLELLGSALASNLAFNSELGVLSKNREMLDELTDGVLNEADVAYVAIFDSSAEPLIYKERHNRKPKSSFNFKEEVIKRKSAPAELVIDYYKHFNEEICQISAPIKLLRKEKWIEGGLISIPETQAELIGKAIVGLSTHSLLENLTQIRLLTFKFTFLIIVIASLLTFFGLTLLTEPIKRLMRATQEVAKGNFNVQLEAASADEVGQLTLSFNQMVKEVKENRDKIENANKELREKAEELKTTQAQLVQSAKMAAVGQLGAGVAHELNNPLAGILGYSQFILEKFKRPKFSIDDFKNSSKYLESIEREASRCKGIVENLLKFSRRPISIKPEPLDVGQALNETLSLIGHQLKLKNINLTLDIKEDLARVVGITNQLQQVFTNLILNAQQAISSGGELKITARNILDETSKLPAQVRIEFTDTGCGISEEHLKHLFEPFFTTKQKEKGTGLGLAVSYQIIQDHRGTIEVKSEVGKGTTISITLPTENRK